MVTPGQGTCRRREKVQQIRRKTVRTITNQHGFGGRFDFIVHRGTIGLSEILILICARRWQFHSCSAIFVCYIHRTAQAYRRAYRRIRHRPARPICRAVRWKLARMHCIRRYSIKVNRFRHVYNERPPFLAKVV